MTDPRYERFPARFFERDDSQDDTSFYREPRLVTHIDDHAIAAVGALYDELAITGDVLDLMSSWISHFRTAPRSLTVLGMNRAELDANPMATGRVVHDLNLEPVLPFADALFDAVTCCVSVDYLVRPLEVFDDAAPCCGRAVCSRARSRTACSPPRRSWAGGPATTPPTARSSPPTSIWRADTGRLMP